MSSATNISPGEEASIKNDVKVSLRMQRKPRNLKLFWYFLWCYKKSTQLPTTSTIGNTLRAPNTVIIQRRLGMKEPDYEPWFDSFCVWKLGGSYNFVSGRMRELKRWTPLAHDLFGKWSHLQIPYDHLRSFYLDTRDLNIDTRYSTIGNTLREWSTVLSTHTEQDTRYSTIGNTLREGDEMETMQDTDPDIDENAYVDEPSPPVGRGDFRRPFYHNTSSSPNRWYHPLQSLTTEMKKQVFKGHVNVDIISCFTSIWWHELGGKDCTLENAPLLHPGRKEDLYRLLMETFDLKSRDEAKEMRQRLTSDYKNKHRVPTGVGWFDDLHDQILSDCYKWAHHNNLQRPTAHKVFTWFEWKIIERMLEAGDEVLLMHDGIIFKEVDVTRLQEAALPHCLQIEMW